jgi:peptide/nickel transport system substrate-binding protein
MRPFGRTHETIVFVLIAHSFGAPRHYCSLTTSSARTRSTRFFGGSAPQRRHVAMAGGRKMTRARLRTVSVAAVAATMLMACGGPSPAGSSPTPTPPPSAQAGINNPSDARGGTLRFANSADWDSLDPADTYYTYAWNFARLYGRSLVTFKSAPGPEGATLVPDLAEGLGVPNADATQWTYTLRQGVMFEDGSLVTSRDVKYAVERSLDKSTFPNGPTYLGDFLDTKGYTSPYSDPDPNKLGLAAIDTPDDRTIVFKLKTPFSGFDYFAQLPATMPVPRAKDTGTAYKEHVVSTGPYMFESVQPGARLTLVRNPNWDPATDPVRKALPDRIEVALNVNADDLDNQLISGDLDVGVDGSGIGRAAQGRILADPVLRANVDSAPAALLWYTALSTSVPPLDNIDCRKAVLYAADRTGYLRAQGGETGGEIATNLLPPVIAGAQAFDLYATPNSAGDPAQAREALARCGRPDGFSTNISYRAEQPDEQATAEALQQSLARVGIALQLKPYPSADYFRLYGGNPAFVTANGLGLIIAGWGADWPDGFGFLSQIVDSRVIREAGNTNLGIADPSVDAMLDQALQTTDTSAREMLWVGIDRKVMENAFVLPGVWGKVLLYRPPTLTNAFITNGFQMYDYVALGTARR